jgi:hypothetical protein
MSKRTLFLIFALLLITFALLMMALYQPSALKTIQQPIVTTKEPIVQTVLSFGNPSVATSSSTSTSTLNYSLPINISTGKNKVTAVQLELQYDPQVLTNVAVTTGSFFTTPSVLLNQIDFKTGRISYAFGISPTGQAIMGKGNVANLTFSYIKSASPEKTAIIFLPKTLVTAEGVSESVLREANVGQITVGVITSSPSAVRLDAGSNK